MLLHFYDPDAVLKMPSLLSATSYSSKVIVDTDQDNGNQAVTLLIYKSPAPAPQLPTTDSKQEEVKDELNETPSTPTLIPVSDHLLKLEPYLGSGEKIPELAFLNWGFGNPEKQHFLTRCLRTLNRARLSLLRVSYYDEKMNESTESALREVEGLVEDPLLSAADPIKIPDRKTTETTVAVVVLNSETGLFRELGNVVLSISQGVWVKFAPKERDANQPACLKVIYWVEEDEMAYMNPEDPVTELALTSENGFRAVPVLKAMAHLSHIKNVYRRHGNELTAINPANGAFASFDLEDFPDPKIGMDKILNRIGKEAREVFVVVVISKTGRCVAHLSVEHGVLTMLQSLPGYNLALERGQLTLGRAPELALL